MEKTVKFWSGDKNLRDARGANGEAWVKMQNFINMNKNIKVVDKKLNIFTFHGGKIMRGVATLTYEE